MRYFKERALPIPTLYVMGRRITCSSPGARAGGPRPPTAGCEIIENCGHVCNVEQPDHFNRQSLAFLSTQASVLPAAPLEA